MKKSQAIDILLMLVCLFYIFSMVRFLGREWFQNPSKHKPVVRTEIAPDGKTMKVYIDRLDPGESVQVPVAIEVPHETDVRGTAGRKI